MHILPISFKYNINTNIQRNREENINRENIKDFSQDYANAIKAQSMHSISFTGKSTPVYLIDKDLNYTLHKKQRELVEITGATPQRISSCLTGRSNSVNDFVIAYPHQVEKTLEDGSVVVSKAKVAELYQRRMEPKAVYTVDYMGKHAKYLAKSHIPSTTRLVIVDAAEVEKFDEDGKMHLDRKQLAQTVLDDPEYSAVYTRDENGETEKHETQAIVANKLNVTAAAIYSAIQHSSKVNGQYNIIPALEIETITEDGEIVVDETKLEEYLSRKISNKRACYIASRDIENPDYTRYESRKDMATDNGINYDSFSKKPTLTTPNGYFIIKATDVEDLNEKEEFVLNLDKLREAIKAKIIQEQLELQENAIYTIDINYKEQRYNDINEVAAALNRKEETISKALDYDGAHKTVANKIVVKAAEIEIIDENGKVSVDRKKIAKLVKERFGNKVVYLVDKNANWRKYRNRYAMTQAYNHSSSAGTNIRLNKFIIVDASLIEDSDEDGIPYVNEDKVQTFAQKSKASFE